MTPALIEALRSKGYEDAVGLKLDGTFQRFNRQGKQLNGWFIGRQLASGHIVARFGDWRGGEKHEWLSWEHDPESARASLEEIGALNRELQDQRKREKEHQEETQKLVSKDALEIFLNARPEGSSQYLEKKKGLPEGKLYGCRLDSREGVEYTLVPVSVFDGPESSQFQGFQYIWPDGEKRFKKGMRVQGGWHIASPHLGSPHFEGVVIICEGIATAASLCEAVPGDIMVVSAFHAGNLKPVAEAWHAYCPKAKIIIAADNDHKTEGNPGKKKAEEAAAAVSPDTLITLPYGIEGTDFNDMHVEKGLQVVADHIATAVRLATGSGVPEMAPASSKPAEPEDPGPHLERKIAAWLLRELDGKIVRQEGSLFKYDGKRWVEMREHEVDSLKNAMNAACGDKLPSKTVNSMFATFLRYVPGVPDGVNLFTPRPDAANFLDGTLHLKRDLETGKYSMEFKPHEATDYLTWLVPVNYNTDPTLTNPLFDKLLDEALDGDPDKEAKITSLQECAGAMLVASFPQIFIFQGESGSRKSTIAKVLLKPLQEGGYANVSFVDPSLMENFQVEGMIGKLVNANTDIDDMSPMPRGFIKRFEDNMPFQVNRKGKKVVNSRLPALHLYCANTLPPNFEKSKAMQRRVTLLKFDRDLTNGPGAVVTKYYEDLVYSASREGIVNFMLKGLRRLVERGGVFSQPESSIAAVQAWTASYDPVAMFLKACGEAEISAEGNNRLMLGPGLKISRGSLWAAFTNWHQTEYGKVPWMGRNKFMDALRGRGFEEKKTNTDRFFLGIGISEQGSGVC